MEEFKEEYLPDMLPLYYNRIFPYNSFYKWLSHGDPKYFSRRELSFTLLSDIYIRHQSFDTREDFIREVQKMKPVKMDIGAVYLEKPGARRMFEKTVPVEKEMVFDIDMTDYDEIRTCCKGTSICPKCWTFMRIACKVLDATLRQDFGFRHLLWVFSGRRGVHCWVCDASVRKFSDEQRDAVAEYLQVIRGGANFARKVQLYGDKVHVSIQRALSIIKPYFKQLILIEQDILGTDERLVNFLRIIDEDLRQGFETVLMDVKTSEERWKVFTDHFKQLSQKGKLQKSCRNMVDEIILQFCYPRLDINVSKSINHLLKAPFCVHPKSGKVSIPFSAKLVDKFDPLTVPTLNLLVDEINAYDKKTKEQEENSIADETSINESVVNESRIKDYKKTSLLKPVATFDEFIRGLEKESKDELLKNSIIF